MDASSDALLVGALEGALAAARQAGDRRSALTLFAEAVAGMNVAQRPRARAVTPVDRDAWIRRLRSAQRGQSTIVAYRNTIDDLLAWACRNGREGALFEEAAMVDYLDEYRHRCDPAPATYHRRFILLRRFMQWLSHRDGLPDPFCDLHAPPKPRQEADWLTPEEFAALLDAAGRPQRNRAGIVQRDRLVLLGLVTMALRRSELLALDWRDVEVDSDRPSVLVRCGKGSKPRRQPISPAFAAELAQLRAQRDPTPDEPVFCGLAGKRLQPTILANIVRRCSRRAGLAKRVTAHTLRHTAATWLRQQTGDARLVAEFLGHADLSTVSRYAHVAEAELHAAAAVIGERAHPMRAGEPRFVRRRQSLAPAQLQLLPEDRGSSAAVG
jgi:integrase/recombinase XerC